MGPRRVLALCGLPGSGKSTLAAALCGRFHLVEIDRDRIRAGLFPDCRFTEEEKHAANAAVLERLRACCAAGASALVDGMTLARASEREALRRVAAEHGFRFTLLWLDCPVELAVARVEGQPHVARDRDAARIREVAARFEPPQDAVRLDATQPAAEVLRRAESALA